MEAAMIRYALESGLDTWAGWVVWKCSFLFS